MGGSLHVKLLIFLLFLFLGPALITAITHDPVVPTEVKLQVPAPALVVEEIPVSDYEPEVPPHKESPVEVRDLQVRRAHPADSYLDKWNLKKMPFEKEDLRPFFTTGAPEAIYYQQNGQTKVIKSPTKKGSGSGEGKILFLSDIASAKKIAQERITESYSRPHKVYPHVDSDEWEKLPGDSYALNYFHPGLRDDGVNVIALPPSLTDAIMGPDFIFVDHRDPDGIAMIRSKVVSFGHNGEMVLEVEGGEIIDQPGPDFVIYENVFRHGRAGIHQEFALVGVAMENHPDNFQWFDCSPKLKVFKGCAGAVPTEEGGDTFDLAEKNIKRVKYIKILDVGYNKNFGNGVNTEGFDLDALKLENAYKRR